VKNWNDPKDLPDDDMEVLVRIDSEDYPIAPAVLDEGWRFMPMGGLILQKIIGWMHVHDAATILDGLEV
jgi:hypothetical protein